MFKLMNHIASHGGTPYLVGGCVRDKAVHGLDPKDIDIEVFGLSYEQLVEILKPFGSPDIIGQQFGVIKLRTKDGEYDISIPRRDSKNGIGHKGFEVQCDHSMTVEEAAARRDFTINSMYVDHCGRIIDHYKGLVDLTNGILRPTSEAFREDPLRLLRGMQFSARFSLRPTEELTALSEEMLPELQHIPKERVWEEWKKFLLKGKDYIKGMEYIIKMQLPYPEITAMYGVPQDKEWHPEGCVFTHTAHVMQEMSGLYTDFSEHEKLVLMLAALCHDTGKVSTTGLIRGRYRAPAHDKAGEGPTIRFLDAINCPQKIAKAVVGLVVNHMMCSNSCITDKMVRRTAFKLSQAGTSLRLLYVLIKADQFGRPPLPKYESHRLAEMKQLAIKENCWTNTQPPIFKGDDLLKIGFTEGKLIGAVLNRLYALQLKGAVRDKASGMKLMHMLRVEESRKVDNDV